MAEPNRRNRHASDAVVQRRNEVVEIFSAVTEQIASRIAHQRGLRRERREELEQVGKLALVEAAAAQESYLRRRVEGAMLDSLRRDAAAREDVCHDVALLPAAPCRLEDLVLASQLHAAIRAALTPRQAQVIVMRLDGYTEAEIAAETDTRQQSVHDAAAAGVRRLRNKLAA